MARKTKEQALETRQNILNAALEVFYQKGVRLSSLEDIAEAAGVTRGAVYWHFKNKSDVFIALSTEFHTDFFEQLSGAYNEAEQDSLERLRSLSVHLFHDVVDSAVKRKALSVFLLKCDYSSDLAHLLEQQHEQKQVTLGLIAQFFEKAIVQKKLSDTQQPDLLAMSYLCYMSGILMEFLRTPKLIDLKGQIDPLLGIFFKGVRS